MKKILNPALLIIASGFLSPHFAAAYELGRVNLRLSGEIVAYTCGVEVSQANKKVNLGRWPLKHLKATGDRTQSMPFGFQLQNCPPSSSVTIVFSGKKDKQDNTLLALTEGAAAAKSVAVEILDSQKKRLPLDTKSPKIAMDINGNGQAQFYANYIATGSQPTPGTADADATFMITYE
ncbi:fimbria assembly protein [Morganella psychrotolerans]|uniref:Adhesin n=1 Tax=Morganella psychrotolerans TaxID=368603 RepID=A0A1B8HE56_9GAMM|nr:fimbria assembly protein [Morganella psychrotolerans]OBU07351.1 adhesin [Morganella psychrotolerans]